MELKVILPLLRQNFEMELDRHINGSEDDELEFRDIFACYDRALSDVLLGVLGSEPPQESAVHRGPKPGSKEAKERATRAAQTRAANRQREVNESAARVSNIERASSGGDVA